jgi:hypothetical protein
MTARFAISPMEIPLPRGAFAGGGRDILRYGDSPLCAFTRGCFRPSLHPVWTPAGFVVTAEQPADHPHHRGIWCASDHVGLLMQGPDGVERYEYCFYVDDVFQGRAPGRIVQNGLELVGQVGQCALVNQRLDWIGPAEWGASDGRRLLTERRWTGVTRTDTALILDITCEVKSGGEIPVAIGPTRHAWFNARLSDGIAIDAASAPTDDQAHVGGQAIPARGPAWVDYSGPVGGGFEAGITVLAQDPAGAAWFVADWGVITVGQVRDKAVTLQPGERTRFCCRFIAHDGAGHDPGRFADILFVTPETILRQQEDQGP